MIAKLKGVLAAWYQHQKRKELLKQKSKFSLGEGTVLGDRFSYDTFFPQENHLYLKIGKRSIVNACFTFESQDGFIEIGDNCSIGSSAFVCRSGIKVGNNVYVAFDSIFYDHNSHSLDYLERRKDQQRELADKAAGRFFITSKDWSVVSSKPIVIEDDAWIGMHCLILKGVTIGRGAVVGAGSVVTRDVPPFTVVGGNPAQILKRLTPPADFEPATEN